LSSSESQTRPPRDRENRSPVERERHHPPPSRSAGSIGCTSPPYQKRPSLMSTLAGTTAVRQHKNQSSGGPGSLIQGDPHLYLRHKSTADMAGDLYSTRTRISVKSFMRGTWKSLPKYVYAYCTRVRHQAGSDTSNFPPGPAPLA